MMVEMEIEWREEETEEVGGWHLVGKDVLLEGARHIPGGLVLAAEDTIFHPRWLVSSSSDCSLVQLSADPMAGDRPVRRGGCPMN